MSGCLSQADGPNVFAFLRKYKHVEPRIQKSDRAYPYFSIRFPVVDHEQSGFKIEVGYPSKRYPMLLFIRTVFRAVEEKLHPLIVYTIKSCVQ